MVTMLSARAKLERKGREEASCTDGERLVQLVIYLPLVINKAASLYKRDWRHLLRGSGCVQKR